MPVDLVMRDGATTSLLPTCATAYPAPVCRCGAWRLAWEEHPVQMLREPGDQPGPVRWWPAMRVVSYYDLGVGAWLFRADCLHGDQQHQVTGTSAQQVRDRLTEFMHRLAP
jgi:hypothetical protein